MSWEAALTTTRTVNHFTECSKDHVREERARQKPKARLLRESFTLKQLQEVKALQQSFVTVTCWPQGIFFRQNKQV